MNLITSLFLFATLLASLVQGWGEIGHRTIGYLAQKYFNADGLALYQDLIAPDAKFDISDGAVWADLQKFRLPYTSVWHYIDAKDNPPTTCKVNYNSDCPKDQGCIISAIKNMTARVNDMDLEKGEQADALKFLLHFLGDVHQPLHTEDVCKGGNGIMVGWGSRGRKVNLHSVWDVEIIQKLLKYKKPKGPDKENVYDKFISNGWANKLFSEEGLNGGSVDMEAECVDVTNAEKCSLDWAGKTNKLVCTYVLRDGVSSVGGKRVDDKCQWEWNGPEDVSLEYYEGAVPIVESQVKLAAMRLGAWVNGLAAQRAAMLKDGMNDGEYLKNQGGQWEL